MVVWVGSERPKKIRRAVRWITGLVVVTGLLAAYGVYNIFEPEHFPMNFLRGDVVQVSENLLVGPYPTEKEIKRLKKLGVTELIGLLDSDMPFEAPLIEKEDRLARKYKLGFRNVPLMYLPNLNSKQNQSRVAELVTSLHESPKKVYVHCYLGRHRTSLVKEKYLETAGDGSVPATLPLHPSPG